MKKLLLLLTIVLTLFTVVYATEADLLISPAPDAAETVTDETVENVEKVEDDSAVEVVPEDGATDVTTGTTDTTVEEDATEEHDHSHETSASGSTVIGAIIAIVVVVGVIALAAFLQMK
ncbi:MAG: hypothetical protein IKK43_04285 [Clostridia bacterium]|nr:hypothetical protein [Clostridia bacterium]